LSGRISAHFVGVIEKIGDIPGLRAFIDLAREMERRIGDS